MLLLVVVVLFIQAVLPVNANVFSVSLNNQMIKYDALSFDNEFNTAEDVDNNIPSDEKELMQVEQEILYSEKQNKDRYIIKYKDANKKDISKLKNVSETAYQKGMEKREKEESERLRRFKNIDKEKLVRLKMKENRIKTESNENVTVSKLTDNTEEFEVIELNESVNSDTFIDNIINELGDVVEYLQPDYVMDMFGKTNTELITESDSQTVTADNIIEDSSISDDYNSLNITETSITDETLEPESNEYDRLYNIDKDLNMALEISRGDNVTVAVIDTGIDVNHPYLSEHITEGWNFVNDVNEVYNVDLGLEQSHGTHIAGIIAKIVPNAKIVPLKVFENGKARTSDIIKAIKYAKENGVTIVNCSFGSTDDNKALKESIEQSGLFFVCASGNNKINIDETPIYPAAFNLPNTISVASLNQGLGMSYFSNYGVNSVDISAVGSDVYSCLPNGEYGTMDGTSMSAALVTGAAALAQSIGVDTLKETLKNTSDKLTCLKDSVIDGNKLSLYGAVTGVPAIKEEVNIIPDDDFEIKDYQKTSTESWELFSSLENKQVVVEGENTYFLKSNGSVWAAGNNSYGQLGNLTFTESNIPVQVYGLFDVKQISAGNGFCIAVCDCGYVWYWGENQNIAKRINELYSIDSVSASYYNKYAIKTDGSVFAWGDNAYGSLGNGNKEIVYSPEQLSITNVKQVVGTPKSTIFLKNDGTVWACGSNVHKILGDGSEKTQTLPVKVMNVSNIIKVSCGTNHAVALTNQGEVYVWGTNSRGQLGMPEITEDSNAVLTVFTDVIDIGADGDYTIIIKNDGTAWSFGYNYYGQLGIGNRINKTSPEQISTLSNITKVILSYSHAAAIDSYGNVWMWGDNSYGQFGNGTFYPTLIVGYWNNLSNARTRMSAGKNHCLYVSSGGELYVSGSNEYGQLGNGTNLDSDFSCVQLLEDIVEVAAGDYFSVALRADGTVWTWGLNNKGQLGDGTNQNSNIPHQILSDIVSISAGKNHALAVTNNNTLMMWGSNEYSQIGINGEFINVPKETGIDIIKAFAGGDNSFYLKGNGTLYGCGKNDKYQAGFDYGFDIVGFGEIEEVRDKDILDISVGENHTVMLDIKGNVYSWGDNSYGQLGISEDTPYVHKVPITGVEKIITKYNSTFAIDKDGNTYSWGDNTYKQLGYETENIYSYIPQTINTDFNSIAAGELSTWISDELGYIYKWGYMPNGNPDMYVNQQSYNPLKIPFGSKFIQVDAKRNSVVALDENGNVYTWGDGSYYDLGHGQENKNINYPQKVEGLPKIVKVAKGKNHTLALDENGYVWGWGNNSSGELGNDLKGKVYIPTKISRIDHITDISAGTGFSAAIREYDGSSKIWTWGNSTDGKLGERGEYLPGTPAEVMVIDAVEKVSCGDKFMAVISNGSVVSWGANDYGQLGNDADIRASEPHLVAGDFKQISTDSEHILALGVDNKVCSWGKNSIGQLGLGDKNNRNIPTAIQSINNVESVGTAYAHSMAVLNNGTVYAWGEGRDGQLGNGNNGTSKTPVKVGEFNNVIQATGGGAFSIVLDKDGQLWSFGKNDFGQLGIISEVPVNMSITNMNNNINTSIKENTLSINGYTTGQGGKQVFIRVLNPSNGIEVLEQVTSNKVGYYSLSIPLKGNMNGTYQVFATIEGEPEIQSSFFNIGHESDITQICTEPPNNIAVPTLLSIQAPSILKGDSSYGVKATIQNDSEEKTQNVMVLTALYDGNDKLVDYSSVHLEIASGEIGSLLPQLYVPANVNDYKVKIFVCEGNDIRYGSMMPLSLSKTIKNNMQPLVSDSELQESKLPSIELTENMDVLDTTRFLSETEAELSSISTIDDIDVDVTLSCNGVYCENVLKQGSDVKVDVSITNNRSSSIPLNCFFYVLKKVPSLLTFYDSCELTIEPGETREFSNTCALSQFDLSQYNSKISILGMGGGIDMQPAIPVIILSNDKQDFFGNDNDKATNVGIGRQIVGDINFLNDIDCIKFVPNETGYYVIQSYGNTK